MLQKNQMVNGMTAAQKAARKAIESVYTGTCTIIERRDVRDEKTKITEQTQNHRNGDCDTGLHLGL